VQVGEMKRDVKDARVRNNGMTLEVNTGIYTAK
jgi:hypothetical protein